MSEVGIDNREGSILREGYDRRFIGAVRRSESAGAGKDGQTEAVVESDNSLTDVATRSGFNPTEHKILVSHIL